jgi:hypothetical protein
MRKKPILIYLLSIFFIFSGITSIALEIYLFQKLDILDLQTIYWVTYRSIFDIILFVIGIGIWFEKKWSWWLAIFFFLHVLMRGSIKLYSPFELKQAISFIFPIVMILILSKESILQYLKVDFDNRLKKIFILTSSSILIFSVFPGVYELGILH